MRDFLIKLLGGWTHTEWQRNHAAMQRKISAVERDVRLAQDSARSIHYRNVELSGIIEKTFNTLQARETELRQIKQRELLPTDDAGEIDLAAAFKASDNQQASTTRFRQLKEHFVSYQSGVHAFVGVVKKAMEDGRMKTANRNMVLNALDEIEDKIGRQL